MNEQVVWFKRDLRWHDHAALAHASQRGPLRCIYVVEPGLWQQADAALQHFEFVRESLVALDAALRQRGGRLEVWHGEITAVLGRIGQQAPFAQLHAHQETGNSWTFARDLQVARWCRAQGVGWHEYPQFGVVRALRDRSQWQAAWERHMAAPQSQVDTWAFAPALPPALAPNLASAPGQHSAHGLPAHMTDVAHMPAPAHLRHNPPQRQRGGRPLALETLRHFVSARSIGYRGGISSPLSAPDACSRLSAHLAWGCISLREVVQHTRTHMAQLPPTAARHRAGLAAFISRLYWHCHFIQKLESEPAIEWRNMHRGYDGLREHDFNPAHLEALQNARTGWPMVDACVTMLHQTGWLNFRMRAMLVSVAAYPLWLHWRPVGEWLATQFLDYEPGIHWSQMQMQSGTTGINTTRVYNPIKQAQDHDPQGRFVRHWLPNLRRVPDTWLFEPWRMPANVQAACGVQVGPHTATPVVDLALATAQAKKRLHSLRQTPAVRAGKPAVVAQHASRKLMGKGRKAPAQSSHSGPSAGADQLGFDF